jgi:hypothetical protein
MAGGEAVKREYESHRVIHDRLRHQALAYRDWTLDQPTRFALIYGTPVPGYQAPAEIMQPTAERSFAAS